MLNVAPMVDDRKGHFYIDTAKAVLKVLVKLRVFLWGFCFC